jgi:hypothetical protein
MRDSMNLYLFITMGAGTRCQFGLACSHVMVSRVVVSALLPKETTEAPRIHVASRHLVGRALERREETKDGKRMGVASFIEIREQTIGSTPTYLWDKTEESVNFGFAETRNDYFTAYLI